MNGVICAMFVSSYAILPAPSRPVTQGKVEFEAPVRVEAAGEPIALEDPGYAFPFSAVVLFGDDHGAFSEAQVLVAGNMFGNFFLFEGDGGGEFSPTPIKLKSGDRDLRVESHSAPYLVDWDGNGDLDLLSGSGSGGVFLFKNEGSAEDYNFGEMVTLYPAAGLGQDLKYFGPDPSKLSFGETSITGPQGTTKVCVEDINSDGKLDLLVGDFTMIFSPVSGLDEETALKEYKEYRSGVDAAMSNRGGNVNLPALLSKKDEIIQSKMTGYVWLLLQK